jgi:N-acetylglutamate synthase-like GNAT family acetyltransferase
MIIEIDELEKYDIETVRYESDKEGYNHISRLIAEYNTGENRFDNTGEKLVGFVLDDKVVAVCGLNIEPTNNNLGRMRRLYVLSKCRHRGIGTELVKYLIKHAEQYFQSVVVNIGDLSVYDFYKSIGFKPVMNNYSYTHILILDHA